MKINIAYLSSFLILFFTSCGSNHLDIDVTKVIIPEVEINRLDQDLFKINNNSNDTLSNGLNKSFIELQRKYGNFYNIFINRIINHGAEHDSSNMIQINKFINDPDMHEAYNDCQKEYPNTTILNNQFTDLFKHYSYYFKTKKTPQIITMMSGFNYSVVLLDNTLAIGLEMYLGRDNKFYKMLAFPQYKTMFMNKENIIPDAAQAWMITEFPYKMDKTDFLSEITYMGKIMYLCDALLPNVPDTVKIKYTEQQLNYCLQNEFNIWSYFANQKLIYTTNQSEIIKYTCEGPFTSAFSKDAPPRIGYWIGWQIIRQYMKNKPELSLDELMKEADAQKILREAKYKPRK